MISLAYLQNSAERTWRLVEGRAGRLDLNMSSTPGAGLAAVPADPMYLLTPHPYVQKATQCLEQRGLQAGKLRRLGCIPRQRYRMQGGIVPEGFGGCDRVEASSPSAPDPAAR